MSELYTELPIFGKVIITLFLLSIIGLVVRSVTGNSELGLMAMAKKRKQCNECKSWIDSTATKCKNCGSTANEPIKGQAQRQYKKAPTKICPNCYCEIIEGNTMCFNCLRVVQ
jgi:hypothetical protein